ncbi:MAG TPA: DUF4065 domain-containing protein [Thermoproteales archaeon]|nr:DUF4065 domain-containing protein [Thermoproteales archaeon]
MREVLLYLILKFSEIYGGEIDGRKKIQKLLFLVEHYDPDRKIVTTSSNTTGYEFIIWSYGPFSKKIYDDIDRSVERGLLEERVISSDIKPDLSLYIDDGYPKRIYLYKPTKELLRKRYDIERKLDEKVVEKITKILKLFGFRKPYKLEEFTNALLRLTQEKKIIYWGKEVDYYLRKERIIGAET